MEYNLGTPNNKTHFDTIYLVQRPWKNPLGKNRLRDNFIESLRKIFLRVQQKYHTIESAQ